MKTRITQLLNLKYPCIQGGMAWIADGKLAAATASAGGVGLIAGGSAPVDYIREQIRIAKSRTEDLEKGAFGVNIMLMSPSAPDIAELVIEEGVRVVTTGAGSPAKYIERWKEAGITVIPVIASAGQAKKMEKAGADAVVAEGMEAGGHIGATTTMALVPQVADAVSIPVIAAGGIADGRGVAAAFMLGAEGVQIGTRFLCAAECNVHENYKQAVLDATDTSTIITGQISGGAAARSIKNAFAREIVALERSGIDKEELEHKLGGSLRLAAVEGDMKKGSIMAGQISGLVNEIKPVSEILKEIFDKAEILLKI